MAGRDRTRSGLKRKASTSETGAEEYSRKGQSTKRVAEGSAIPTSYTQDAEPFNFLGLPLEVRNKIYEHSLQIALTTTNYEDVGRPNIALLRTNKQVYEEASDIFGKSHGFIRFSTDCLAAIKARDLPPLVFANLSLAADLLYGEDAQLVERLRSTNASVKAYPRCILDVEAYLMNQSEHHEEDSTAERSDGAGDGVETYDAHDALAGLDPSGQACKPGERFHFLTTRDYLRNLFAMIGITDLSISFVYSEQISMIIHFLTPFGKAYRAEDHQGYLENIQFYLRGFKNVQLRGPGLDEQVKTTALSRIVCRRWLWLGPDFSLTILQKPVREGRTYYEASDYKRASIMLKGVYRQGKLLQMGSDGTDLARAGGPEFCRALLRLMQYNSLNLFAVCLTWARSTNNLHARLAHVTAGYRWWRNHMGGFYDVDQFITDVPDGWSDRGAALLTALKRLFLPVQTALGLLAIDGEPNVEESSEMTIMEVKLLKEGRSLVKEYLEAWGKDQVKLTDGEMMELMIMLDRQELEIRGHEPGPYPLLP